MTTQRHNNTTKAKSNRTGHFVVSSFRSFVNKKGFTLSEMLIVLILIGVLTAFGGRQYYTERDRFIYNNNLTKILQIISTARNSAITSRSVPSGSQNIVPASGYGVYINLQPEAGMPHFTLFASMEDHDNNEKTLNTDFNTSKGDQVIDSFRLPDKFHFQFFEFKPGGATPQTWNPQWTGTQNNIEYKATEAIIIFRPPLAETYIAGGKPDPYKALEDLGMRFYNPDAPVGSAKRCQYITINRIQTFPSLGYDDCFGIPPSTPPLSSPPYYPF